MRAWTLWTIVLLGCLALASSAQAAGMLTIESIEPPSGGATGRPPTTGPLPTINGEAIDLAEPVYVLIYEGESTSPLLTLEASPNGQGEWAVMVPSGDRLPSGSYTAVAEQEDGAFTSPPFAFSVSTSSPEVVLSEPAPRIGKASPIFSGMGSEPETEVTVDVVNSKDEVIDSGTTTVSDGKWSTGLESPLSGGSYAVYATEASALGNLPGHSTTYPLEVDTEAPHVTLDKPAERTRDTEPVFSGTGSEEGTKVVVHVLNAAGTKEIDKGETTVAAGGSWSTGLEKQLAEGDYSYTVYATEASSLSGNPAGESARFKPELDTDAPSVSLTEPAKRSNNLSPSFSGTGSEEGTKVVVHVLNAAGTKEIDKGETTVGAGGSWSTGLEKPLAKGKYSFTVYATEASSLSGNPAGESAHFKPELDTEAPSVSLTEPPKRSNSLSPSFSGTGSEEGTKVLVHVLNAASEEIDKGETTVAAGGSWSTGLEKPLAKGKYSFTVYATEASSLSGNPAGESAHFKPELDTEAPSVSLTEPPKRSNNLSPSFSGTGSEEGTKVLVHVLNAASEEIDKGETTVAAGGSWSTGLEKPLAKGKYSFTVYATEASSLTGNPAGESAHFKPELDTEAPSVSLTEPPKRSNNLSPSFSGTGSEEGTKVLVHVLNAASEEIDKGETTVAAGGSWSTGLEKQLAEGDYIYTVYATEASSLSGSPVGESARFKPELDTDAPSVSLNEPAKRSNNLSPSFSGTGSEEGTKVVVHVLNAAGTKEIDKGETTVGAGGSWSTGLETSLPKGEYEATVVAVETSSLSGNPHGESKTDGFEIDTEAPSVTLTKPPKRSNSLSPSFSGTGSEEGTKVLVHVLNAASEEIDKGETKVAAGGSWSTGLEKPLAKGKYIYTVYATEASSLTGNPAGESAHFKPELDTEAPSVSLTEPPKRSNNLSPSFSGTGSEEGTKVLVHALNAASEEIDKGETTVAAGGSWSTGLEKQLAEGDYIYTVYATEASSLSGSPVGESAHFKPELDTDAPSVSLNEPPKRSNNLSPSFSGTGSEEGTKVVVHVLNAAGTKEIDKGETTVGAGGSWSTGLETSLPKGEYEATVVAVETSSLSGNPHGESKTDGFEIDTEAPSVTLTKPPKRSNSLSPSFSGTGSEEGTKVLVHVLNAASEEIDKGETKVAAGGSWSTGLEKPLAKGKYIYTVYATEASSLTGNPAGESAHFKPELDTDAPSVSLNEPVKRSNNPSPSFSGTGSEEGTEVVVHVLNAEEKEIDKGKTTVAGGKWSTGLEKSLAKGDYSYTVYATEASSLSPNPAGESARFKPELDTEAPSVLLSEPSKRSNNTSPSFSGTGSEEGTEVVVHVLNAEEKEIGKGKGTVGAGGSWSATVETPLAKGKYSYTVYATEASGLSGNSSGESHPRYSVELDTEAPKVSLSEPSKRSNNTSPSFSGTGSEEGTEVVVHVLNAEEKEIGKGKGTVGAGGSWSATVETPLAKGKYSYTVYATEASGLSGNSSGESHPRYSVELDTEAPKVSLSEPSKRSNNTSPSFSGTGSEEGTKVLVHVLNAEEKEIDRGETTVAAGGSWSTGLEKALATGKYSYTVYATEVSGLSPNPAGESGRFKPELDTEAPSVSLNEPPKRSNNTSPTFSGTGSEEGTEVLVHVLNAAGTEELDKGKTKVGTGGAWSTGLEKPLAKGDYSYTVYATEVSGLSPNPAGESGRFKPELDTEAPKVSLSEPPKRSNNLSPSFSGTGSEEGTEVVVHVLNAEEKEIGKGKGTVGAGGSWSATVETPLAKGKYSYTVYATEVSGLSPNPAGESGRFKPELDTEAPKVSLSEPPKRSNNLSPSFSGTGSEEGTEVVVHVLNAEEKEIDKGKTTVAGGKWSTGLEKPLAKGDYSYTVYAVEVSGLSPNPAGESARFKPELDTEAPSVSLSEPPKRSNNLSPSFSGTGSEEGTEVVVHVLNAEEKEIDKGKTTVAGGKWSTGLEKPLSKGEYSYTVYATEVSGLSPNPAGESGRFKPELDTEAPKVSLSEPPKRSNILSPTFSGTGSEEGTEVVVHVLNAEEKEIDKGKTTVAGGKWSTGLEKPLTTGKYSYTVYATEVSGLSPNPAGESARFKPELDTEAPSVSLSEPPKRSNNLSPTFSGTGSEEGTEILVHVMKGKEEVGKGKTKVGAGGKWSTGLEGKLPKGEYSVTVFAVEISGLSGNPQGETKPDASEIDTEAPQISLEPVALISDNTTPTFTGTSNESTSVTVRVFKEPAGTLESTLVTQVSSGTYKVTASSPLSNGEYEVIASQPSGLEGNPSGSTKPLTFQINTEAPQVEMTKPPAESNNRTPSFSGTVKAPKSEEREVKVEVHEGPSYTGPLARTIDAKVVAGHWETGKVEALALGTHTYTAVASTESALGNGEGRSAPATFVVNTEAPTVKLEQPASPTRQTKPTFFGTATEEGEISVHVREGATEVEEASAHTSHGEWSVTLPKALSAGEHRFTVYATEPSGLGNEEGRSVSWGFTLDTLPPTVVVTEGPPPTSSDRHPLFAGTASDSTEVTVAIHEGSGEAGPVKATLTAKVEDGDWAAQVQEPLEFGEYTAIATQPSSLGNEEGKSELMSFDVAKISPTALTEAPAAVAETHVALYGSVNPEAGPISSCVFEVGTTTAYGRKIECGFVSGMTAFASNSTGPVAVFVRVYALRPNTLYHERLVAVGEGGTGEGADQTFTTLPEEVPTGPAKPAQPTGTSTSGTTASASNVLGLLAERLIPTGAEARIGALLRNDGYRLRFSAPEAGKLELTWFQPSQKARGGHARTPQVVVATGDITVKAAGTVTLKIKLTAAGRRLLKNTRRIELSATTVFTPVGGKPVKSTGSFVLRR